MDKSPDAFRTISEVAEHLETPAHVLRFWESRFPQIRPVKRAGGRRYYRPSDVSLLMGIKRLLHEEGMTIRGVQKILREQGVRYVAGLSGDHVTYDATDDAPFSEHQDGPGGDVVVALKPEPTPSNSGRTISAAIEKVQDVAEPAAALKPALEPAQGALLLTSAPSPVKFEAETSETPALPQTPVIDTPVTIASNPAERNPAESSDDHRVGENFEDEDFEAGLVSTVASRIRSLPPEASARQVGAELLEVVARLQSLRNRMADAAQPGRA